MKYSHPIYSSLAEQAAVQEADYNEFRKEFDALWAKDNDLMGLVLKCHLIVEFYMTECLRVSLPGIDRFDEARLTFAQKHHLLTGWTFGFPWVKDGVAALNSLRNKVAHNIHYSIEEKDLKKIYDCMDPIYSAKMEDPKRGSEALIDFSSFAAMALAGWTREIQRHAPATGAAGYNELCKERYKQMREQDGAGQPATRPAVEPDGGVKPQPEAEGRSRKRVARPRR